MSALVEQPAARIPTHYIAFGAAALATGTAVAIWVMDSVAASPTLARGTNVFLTSLAMVLWVWYLAERNRHETTELRELIADLRDRLDALDGPRSTNGLDAETIDSARMIARQLLNGR